jgi:hypothetical protein
MNKTQMLKKIAHLEFIQDQLTAELSYVDHLLRNVGFPKGLESAKSVAEELISENNIPEDFPERNEDFPKRNDKLIDF